MSEAPYRGPSEREADEPPVDPARPWALQTWVSQRTCPVCDVPLFAARKEGYRIDACGRCGGAWLPSADAKRMVDERSIVVVELGNLASAQATAPTPIERSRPCLDCAQPLTRRQARTITIDVCEEHGTWFDAGELEIIRQTVLARLPPKDVPGLDEEIRALARYAETRDGLVAAAAIILGAASRRY